MDEVKEAMPKQTLRQGTDLQAAKGHNEFAGSASSRGQ
jgi:hypothetical protein